MADPSGIFADNAMTMYRHGLAVLPLAADRTPSIKGFDQWTIRPGVHALKKWMRAHPTDNIAIVPNLSGVLVADCDDASQDGAVEELLGPTPLVVVTRRGRHRYYRKVDQRLPGNLRSVGLEVDLKARGIVIAPPSLHESGHIYRLDACDWSALNDVPPLNLDKLLGLLAGTGRGQNVSNIDMRDGSRGQWLNDQLCRQVMACGSFEELLHCAATLANELEAAGIPRLSEAMIAKRAQKVWHDAQSGKLQQLSCYKGTVKTNLNELDALCQHSPKHGPDALALLLKLRVLHTARCRRGETFCLTPRSMAEHNVVSGWTRERIQKARDVLLQTGKIVRMVPFRRKGGKRQAAQYRLAKHDESGGAGG
jgi:hypothetical protein